MRLIDADALIRFNLGDGIWIVPQEIIDSVPTIAQEHGLFIKNVNMPIRGCCFCIFREGNLCKFLPASVPVVECGKRCERHKDCPLVEV